MHLPILVQIPLSRSESIAFKLEREFAICTLFVIGAVESGYDEATDLSQKFHDRAADYDQLPTEPRDEILDAYSRAHLARASGLVSSYRPADD